MFFDIPFFIWFCLIIFLIECWFYFYDNHTFIKYTFSDVFLSLIAVLLGFSSYQIDYEKLELKNEAQILQSKIQIMELKK